MLFDAGVDDDVVAQLREGILPGLGDLNLAQDIADRLAVVQPLASADGGEAREFAADIVSDLHEWRDTLSLTESPRRVRR